MRRTRALHPSGGSAGTRRTTRWAFRRTCDPSRAGRSIRSTIWSRRSSRPAGNEQGPNLVTNGSFESNLTGWTASGFASLGFDYGIDSTTAHTGTNSFQGGALDSLGFLSQTVSSVAGTSYNIDLWLASDG